MTVPRIAFANPLPILAASCSSQPPKPSGTAGAIDLPRYAGRWDEIARLPHSFQRGDSRATATVGQAGVVRVVNTGYRPDGSTEEAEGAGCA